MNTKTMEQFNMLNADTLATIEGGGIFIGFRWVCTDGKKSAWHMFKGTAQDNANNYMLRNPGVTCTVDHA
ncbi:TPA: ComC/BlpC family peptide pheromone/bacteriocin [Streptococcus suis]|nr:ComC/BlpC family peptide pheromone/bacteriocin [Streptococcus suis]